MKVRSLFLILIWGFIQGCSSLVIENHLVGNYYLTAPDEYNQLALTYHAPDDGSTYGVIISGTVFAIGYNEKYLIAKQHPYIFAMPLDTTITKYYILPLKDSFDFRTMNGLIGPMTKNQFILKRHELGIPDSLTFTKACKN